MVDRRYNTGTTWSIPGAEAQSQTAAARAAPEAEAQPQTAAAGATPEAEAQPQTAAARAAPGAEAQPQTSAVGGGSLFDSRGLARDGRVIGMEDWSSLETL